MKGFAGSALKANGASIIASQALRHIKMPVLYFLGNRGAIEGLLKKLIKNAPPNRDMLRSESAVRRRFFCASVALFALCIPLAHADPPPGDAEVQAMLSSMREAALAFDSRLPDFICSQVTRREMGVTGGRATVLRARTTRTGNPDSNGSAATGWRELDTFEQELTYFGHKESYKLLTVNGMQAIPDRAPPPGAGSSGEFGTTLRGIFDPASHAAFKWKSLETLRGEPVYVFSFDIAKENSTAQIVAGTRSVVVAYHGLIFADRDSKTILRVTTEAETPRNFPLQQVTHVLDYGQVVLGGKQYLVPLHGEMQMSARKDYVEKGRPGGTSPLLPFRNTIDFRAYRKYSADAVLKPE